MRVTGRGMVRTVLIGGIGAGVGGFVVGGAGVDATRDRQPGALADVICYHSDGSRWSCPDSTANRGVIRDGSDVERVALTIRLRGGRTVRAVLPAGTDAVFLTPEAMEILAEHYDRGDAASAAAIRRVRDWAARRAEAPPPQR